jgi:hypothetical protein
MMRLGYNAPANSAVEASRPRSLCPARSTTASFPGERHPLRYLPYQFDRRLILVPATESTIRPCRPFGNAGRKLQLVAILALLIDTIETKSAGMPVERQRPETSGAPARPAAAWYPRDEMHSSADDRLARLDSAVATASPAPGQRRRGDDGRRVCRRSRDVAFLETPPVRRYAVVIVLCALPLVLAFYQFDAHRQAELQALESDIS